MIKKPEFIIFDYGNTLIHEDVDRSDRAYERVYDSITTNPRGYSLSDVYNEFKAVRRDIMDTHHRADMEFRYTDLFKITFVRLGLKSNLSYEQLSRIYFDDYAKPSPMYGAVELLDYLEEENIGVGIISNLSFSGQILKTRVEKVLGHKFKYVITSGDWIYRKPDKRLFEIGIKKADTDKSQIWYVGDNPRCDVYGAKKAGIVPVFYDSVHDNPFIHPHEEIELDMKHIKIDHLLEIKELISK